MNRRQFLAASAGIGLGALLPLRARADSWYTSFHQNLQTKPWLAGFRSMNETAPACAALAVEGRFPAELSGTFFRIGPARHELGGVRYRHWFDGDGMAHAFRIRGSRVSHAGRMVETEKYLVESRAGRFLRPAFGTPGMQALAGPDAANAANTNILPFNGRLFALWEAGSAYELDPATLATRGPVTWRGDLQGLPFSAHPKVDTDGTLWNFGTSVTGMLVLYRISSTGQLLRAEALAVPDLPMIHDFAVTAHHLVFLLPPLAFDRQRFAAGASVLDSYVWRGDAPMRVLLIDKSDWSQRRWHELPPGFLFHLGNAWEDESGAIRFAYMRSENAAVLTETFRDVMRGEFHGRYQPHTALVTLRPGSAPVRQELIADSAEFPRFDARYAAGRARQLFTVTDISQRIFAFHGIQRRDLESGALDRFSYGSGFQVEEHVFVPRAGSRGEADGWLVGTAFDIGRGVTVLSVFDAANLAAGPVARASLPYGLPLGFHGNFLPA